MTWRTPWRLIHALTDLPPDEPVKIARRGCGRSLRVCSVHARHRKIRRAYPMAHEEERAHVFVRFAEDGDFHSAEEVVEFLLQLPVDEEILVRRSSCRRGLSVEAFQDTEPLVSGTRPRGAVIWLEWEAS